MLEFDLDWVCIPQFRPFINSFGLISLTPPDGVKTASRRAIFMTSEKNLLIGEFRRTLDERHRLSLPPNLLEDLADQPCILAKERPGALSLWNANSWQTRLDSGVQLVQSKMQAGRLEGRLPQVQQLGRLLSTRHCEVQLAGRGRLTIPEGFREFLGVEPGGELMTVGAAICVEIWSVSRWIEYVDSHIVDFHSLFQGLAD
jgi:MraZ protein